MVKSPNDWSKAELCLLVVLLPESKYDSVCNMDNTEIGEPPTAMFVLLAEKGFCGLSYPRLAEGLGCVQSFSMFKMLSTVPARLVLYPCMYKWESKAH